MALTVGIVGLGAMGSAIAANLVEAGFGVVGYDVDADRLAVLRGRGGEAASSAAGVAAAADVVITSLPSELAFAAVVSGPTGIVTAVRPGLVVIETSTLPIAVKERARRALADAGATLLDCPLSGTADQTAARDVVVLASGDAEAIDRSRPVFEGFARATHDLGEFGNGSRMKFVANHLVAVHNAAAAEALNLARAAGLDVARALEVLVDSAGSSRMLAVRGPKMVERTYGGGIRGVVFQKDLDVIGAFAAEHDAPTPLLEVAAGLHREATEAGYGEQDTAAVFEVYADGRRDAGA